MTSKQAGLCSSLARQARGRMEESFLFSCSLSPKAKKDGAWPELLLFPG